MHKKEHMKKRLYSVSILIVLLSLFMLSCNLDGAGIFLSQSKAQVVPADDEIDTVHRIINVDTDTMYIQQGLTIKLRDISVDESSWDEVTALNGTVNSAVHAGSSYYIALNDYDSTTASVYEFSSLDEDTPASSGDATDMPQDIKLGSLFEDGTHAFALYLDGTDVKLTALDAPTTATATATVISGAGLTPSADSFSLHDEGTTSHLFVTVSDAFGDRSSYYGTYDDDTTTLSTTFTLIDEIDSYLVGGTIFDDMFFLYTKEGDVLRTAVTGSSPSTFTSVLADEISLDLDDMRNSGIPTVQVTGTDTDTDTYALIAGNSSLYEINLTDAATGAVTPTEPTADAGNYYYNFSSSRVLDFYDTTGAWSFFVSTAGSSVLEVTAEDASSVKL
jgi:hypothetical protein